MIKNKLFISFLTAGDPNLDATRRYIELLSKYSDFVEIGIPFSDPVADGEVIERANARAIKNGTTIDKIFDMLAKVKLSTDKKCRLVFLSYANPIFFYGYEKFAKRAKEVGVVGVIIPDLPFEEQSPVKKVFSAFNIELIQLVASTSGDRVEKLCKNCGIFTYLVSGLGTTGKTDLVLEEGVKTQIEQIRKISKAPIALGFGISNKQIADKARELADGVIIGSPIVKAIETHGENAEIEIERLIKELL